MNEPVLSFLHRKRLPVIHGAEAAECGLACLAMLAGWHGLDIRLNSLRQRFPTSLSGLSLRGLMDIAERLGFASRAARVELEDLAHLPLPLILHWNLNHFVVLRSITRRGAVIHDPAHGARNVTNAELSSAFTGVILELEPTTDFTTGSDGGPLRLSELAATTHGLWGAVFTVLGLTACLQMLAFLAPLQIQFVIDGVLSRGDGSILPTLALAFAGLVILQATVEWVRAWAILAAGYTGLFQVMGNLVRHLSGLPLSWFEARGVGDIMSRLGSAGAIQDTLTRGVVTALLDGIMALTAGVLLFAYAPPLALIALVGTGIGLVVSLVVFGPLRERVRERLAATAQEQTYMMETVRAISTIKTMGREGERTAEWRGRYAQSLRALASVGKYHAGLASSQTLINGLQVVCVVGVGATMVIDGRLSAGMLVAFLAFRQIFSDRTTTFMNQLLEFRLLAVHLERLSDIVQSPPEASDGVCAPMVVTGKISLRSVSFRYGATDREILKDICLEVEPGAFIAITGASGGGKTTLLKLMTGLLTPTEGALAVEDAPASPERWRAWRSHVGFVSQEDRLLAGSLADNIAFFDPNLDMERVRIVAERVGLHREILAMPMQYLTLVGDLGSALSSGQKQRVFMARALYGDPKVLILDEGTANLDEEAEATITELIRSLPITRIVVAHRPALVLAAQRRLEVLDGRLVEGESQASMAMTGVVAA